MCHEWYSAKPPSQIKPHAAFLGVLNEALSKDLPFPAHASIAARRKKDPGPETARGAESRRPPGCELERSLRNTCRSRFGVGRNEMLRREESGIAPTTPRCCLPLPSSCFSFEGILRSRSSTTNSQHGQRKVKVNVSIRRRLQSDFCCCFKCRADSYSLTDGGRG